MNIVVDSNIAFSAMLNLKSRRMAKREVIWTRVSEIQLYEILELRSKL